MIRIEVDDKAVRARLSVLAQQVADLRPALSDIGEYLVMSTKQRFGESRSPDGTPWAPNSPVTIMRYLSRFGGTRGRRGLTKKGAAMAAAKKPLIGETRRLSTEISYQVGTDSLEVGSSLEYAAIQQLGARKGQSGRTRRGAPIPWGDIPPRPFLGISESDRAAILEIVSSHLGAKEGL